MNYNRHSSFSALECSLVENEKYLTLLFPILAFNLKPSATKNITDAGNEFTTQKIIAVNNCFRFEKNGFVASPYT